MKARKKLAEWSKTNEGQAKYEEVANQMRKEINPIDYWYKKYIALKERERISKPELTWEDMMTIDVLLHDISDEKCTIRLKEFYKEVLRRFNEAKQKQK